MKTRKIASLVLTILIQIETHCPKIKAHKITNQTMNSSNNKLKKLIESVLILFASLEMVHMAKFTLFGKSQH